MKSKEVRIVSDPIELARHGAYEFSRLAGEAIAERDRFAVALAGGTTPKLLYQRLGTEAFVREGVRWSRVQLFWGDERCVPPEHADSNFRMVEETMLSRLPVPLANIHRMHGERARAERGAREYAEELASLAGDGTGGANPLLPRFDLVLLGLGADGHTASLFPGSEALHVSSCDKKHWVLATHAEKLKSPRLTLSLPVINNARFVIFLVSGLEKSRVLRQILQGEGGDLPAAQVQPAAGSLLWLADAEAASALDVSSRPPGQ